MSSTGPSLASSMPACDSECGEDDVSRGRQGFAGHGSRGHGNDVAVGGRPMHPGPDHREEGADEEAQ